MVGLGAIVFFSVSMVSPAAAGGGNFDEDVWVTYRSVGVGHFVPESWSVKKKRESGVIFYEWYDPDVTWQRYGGTQVKWNVRPYCHKRDAGIFGEVIVVDDFPLGDHFTRGPSASGGSNFTPGDRREGYHELEGTSSIFDSCTVIRLHFKPYVLVAGEWISGETIHDYARVPVDPNSE